MKKISKKLHYLLLVGAMCMTVSQKAVAFGFLPPLPPDFVVDIPGDAGKISSNVQAMLRQLETYRSQLNSLNLDALKGMLGQAFTISTPKSVGRGDAKAVTIGDIHIEKGSVSETDYFNAYGKLFFEYPPVPNGITTTVMQTAYKHKANEYLQDIIIDTYVTGRVTEDYLALVEKTIERLGRCQDGSDTGNCKFFGMQFSDVPSISDNAADAPGDDKGQLGVATNGYIITTMYDRLLRIIEDLTATEAIYRAAKQNGLVRPVSPQSSADTYIDTKYHFAYHQTNETSYAKGIVSTAAPCEKDPSRPGCANASHDKAEIIGMDSAEILGKLQQIDQWQQEAMILHNLRVQLPGYKTQYRKYLKAKEIHEKTLRALKKNDECARDFIKNHEAKKDDPDLVWDIDRWKGVSEYNNYAGLVKANNQYKDRKGLSASLIADYELAVNETIMGSEGECSGYYRECPSGYVLKYKTDEDGKEVPVTCDTNKEYFACTMEMVTMDTSSIEDNPNAANNFEGTELLQNSSDEDRIATESRIKAEKTWRIGRNKLMSLTEDHKLKFKPWNDQKSMQALYLRRKYNNIKTIINSTDDAFNSFKIVTSKLTEMVDENQYKAADDTILGGVNKWVQAASRCVSPANVTDNMIKNSGFCSNAYIDSAHPCPANVVRDVNGGKVTASKTTGRYVEDGKYVYPSTSVTWNQIVSTDASKCAFRQAEATFSPNMATASNCPATWDLTPSFLIKHYFPEVDGMGGCKTTLEAQATNMRNKATNNQRVVAWDKLADVIDKRIENDAKVNTLVRRYNNEQNARKNAITSYKNQLNNISKKIDVATKTKNAARKLKSRAEDRISSIDEEISYLIDQVSFLKSQKTIDYAQICSNEVQQYKLNYEKAAIEEKSVAWKTPESCNTVRKSDKSFNLDVTEVAGLSINKFIMSFNEAYDAQKDELKKSKDNKSVRPSETKVIISNQDTLIDNYKITRDEINKKIQETQDAMTAAAENFANPESVKDDKGQELSYIVVATDAQEALDESNNNFEKFVEGGHRMQRTREYHCYKPLFHSRVCEPIDPNEKDNLEATMVQYIYGKGLEDAIRQGLEETWTGDSKLTSLVQSLSQNMHIPAKFVADESFLVELGIPAGLTTTTEVVRMIKEKIVQYAVEQIAEKIRWSDSVIEQERTAASEEVDSIVMNPLGLNDEKISAGNLNNISNHDLYAKGAWINKKHNDLVASLRKPKYADAFKFVDGDLSSIWGIPDKIYEDNQFRDSEYFIAKPARGVKYLNNNGAVVTDANAGRDFKAPQEPLLNLPPLREVFYFNALDYDDMPRNGDVPTLTNFLNLKYHNLAALGIKDSEAEKWEYLPQVWLYLLARPNTRNDGNYQQTFVEDSYGDGTIQDLISGSDQDYNAVIDRSGVYPCKLKNFGAAYPYVDAAGGNGVGDIRFYKRASLPSGVKERECLEIEAKNGITHLMADHVPDENGNLHDYQKDIGTTNISAHDTLSELGQMFRFDDNKLKYRALQRNIHEYLLDNNHTDNDINRRKAEAASFKRNIFGSFLEMVNYEHNAKKNLDTSEKNVKNSLNSLCTQIHAQGVTVGTGDDINDSEACVKVIMDNGGLASSADDKIYGESEQYGKINNVDVYAGVGRNNSRYYDKIYYLLADQEAKLLNNAMNGAAAPAPTKEGEDPTMCGTVKNRHCGYKDILSKFTPLERERVQERLSAIVQYFNAFNGDDKGVVYLSPDKVGKLKKVLLDKKSAQSEMLAEVNNAKADATTGFESDDRSIQSMDSQNSSVPYCPIYVKD